MQYCEKNIGLTPEALAEKLNVSRQAVALCAVILNQEFNKFVILLPMFVIDITGLGEPWFCKFICPVGTLEGDVPLVLLNSAMRGAAGFLFKWKLLILIITLLSSIVIYRPFCRYVCPLGALYGIFNKISFYCLKIDSKKCTKCGACQKACKLDIPVWQKPDSMDCIRCGDCKAICPQGAISTSIIH